MFDYLCLYDIRKHYIRCHRLSFVASVSRNFVGLGKVGRGKAIREAGKVKRERGKGGRALAADVCILGRGTY